MVKIVSEGYHLTLFDTTTHLPFANAGMSQRFLLEFIVDGKAWQLCRETCHVDHMFEGTSCNTMRLCAHVLAQTYQYKLWTKNLRLSNQHDVTSSGQGLRSRNLSYFRGDAFGDPSLPLAGDGVAFGHPIP